MNIQEGIKELESLKMKSEDIRTDCFNNGLNAGITVMKKIDELQQPVVPQFVGEYLNYCMAIKRITLREALITGKFQLPEYLHKAVDWLNDSMNQNIFARAWLYGYEVEKEPLYYVYFPEIIASPEIFFPDIEGAYLMKSDDGIELADNNDFEDMKFTEREIKAIDERYWPFAVPVEEVVEG